MTAPAEIVPGLLWQGSRAALDDIPPAVENIVSILPFGSAPAHETAAWVRERVSPLIEIKTFVCLDRDALDPGRDIVPVIDIPEATLIHCNAGVNRSRAFAACWLLYHGHARFADESLTMVGGCSYPEMTDNVRAFAKWYEFF